MTWNQKLPWIVGLLILVFFVAAGTGMLNTASSNTTTKATAGFQLSVQQGQQGQPQQKSSTYSVIGKPSISVSFINRVLTAYSSPAVSKGQALYKLGVQYGIDPAFALAFFQHESTFGKAGEASTTLSLGNLRCIPDAACVNTSGQVCQVDQSCYASFPTWEAGFEAWYRLIRNLYVNTWKLTTIDQIIPRYAPPGDNNNDDAYIASLKHNLDTWHRGEVQV